MAAHGEARVTRGERGGVPALLLLTEGGASAEVSLHGAQLLSWRPAGGREWIFLSERADYAVGKAIRGGVPICFPWFGRRAGSPEAPQHGFARILPWLEGDEVDGVADVQPEAVRVRVVARTDARLHHAGAERREEQTGPIIHRVLRFLRLRRRGNGVKNGQEGKMNQDG